MTDKKHGLIREGDIKVRDSLRKRILNDVREDESNNEINEYKRNGQREQQVVDDYKN